MVNQITPSSQQLTIPNLVSTVQQLSTSLQAIQPINFDQQTTQLITYTLIATALVGIFVYHYIKQQEAL